MAAKNEQRDQWRLDRGGGRCAKRRRAVLGLTGHPAVVHVDCGVKTGGEQHSQYWSCEGGLGARAKAYPFRGRSPWAGAPRFSVAAAAAEVVVSVDAVVSIVGIVGVVVVVDVVRSGVVTAVLSEVAVKIDNVRVRLGSPSMSVATETTTVLPDLFDKVSVSQLCLRLHAWDSFAK